LGGGYTNKGGESAGRGTGQGFTLSVALKKRRKAIFTEKDVGNPTEGEPQYKTIDRRRAKKRHITNKRKLDERKKRTG